jgi:hypothetical protein
MYNFDASSLALKIVEDIAAAQLPSGLVPDIAPEYVVFDGGFRDSPEWGSALLQLPGDGNHARLAARAHALCRRQLARLLWTGGSGTERQKALHRHGTVRAVSVLKA